MLELCKKAEDENLKILGVVRTDNILFMKKRIHYATAGARLERILSEYFGEPVMSQRGV